MESGDAGAGRAAGPRIARSCSSRARRFCWGAMRRGALIVIEQQSGLKEYCETRDDRCTRDSREELLLAIFTLASPLHDGAVIVREGRIEAAGCFLPLAEQSLTHRRLGTRHRAALGLSRADRRRRVVVSEQTGAVTIARGGQAFAAGRRRAAAHQDAAGGHASAAPPTPAPPTSSRTCVPRLRSVRASNPSTRFVRPRVQIVRKNFALKLLAGRARDRRLGVLSVRQQPDRRRRRSSTSRFRFRSTAVNLPVGYVAHFADREAVVTVAAKRGDPAIKPDEIKAVLDLSNKETGVYNVPVHAGRARRRGAKPQPGVGDADDRKNRGTHVPGDGALRRRRRAGSS